MSRVLTKKLLQQENEVLTSESNHLHELLNALPAAVYMTDRSGRITFYNEAAATLCGDSGLSSAAPNGVALGDCTGRTERRSLTINVRWPWL